MVRPLGNQSGQATEPFRIVTLLRNLVSPGPRNAIPAIVIFVLGFLGPLIIAGLTSFTPEHTFGFTHGWTVDNYLKLINSETHYIPFLWSFGLALATVGILLLVCYPAAYGLAKVFGKWSAPIMLLMVLPLFVSENVRLFGWVIFLMKGGGIFAGTLKTLFGIDPGSILYQASAVLLGLCYVYLPFMLFPMMLGVSMVPKDIMESASDLGANRWQIFREVELPLAMPGVLVGGLLTFILAVGAISEATILGGQNAPVVAIEIRHLFTYAQNWPMGSSVAMLVTVFTAILVVAVLSRLNLDRLLGKR